MEEVTEVTMERRRTAVRGLVGSVNVACCAVVPGTADRGAFVPPSASGIRSGSGTTTSDSVLPGRSYRESSPLYFGGPGGEAP